MITRKEFSEIASRNAAAGYGQTVGVMGATIHMTAIIALGALVGVAAEKFFKAASKIGSRKKPTQEEKVA